MLLKVGRGYRKLDVRYLASVKFLPQRLWRRGSAALTASLLAAVLVLGAGSAPSRADGGRPSDTRLVLAGLAMAAPTYFMGVIAHEGSHALAAKMMGKRISYIHLLPGREPVSGAFYFGYVRLAERLSNGERVFFLLAPKMTDAIMLAGFATLTALDGLPDNAYGALALTVPATGFWVDFSRDIFAFWPTNDTVKIYNQLGLTSELKRLPLRLVHAGVAAVAGYYVWRGYEHVFREEPTAVAMLPLVSGAF